MGRLALPILAQLEAVGADVDAVLASAGLRRGQLTDPDSRIEHERWVALLEVGATETADPAFGLHAAEHLSHARQTLPNLLVKSFPTLAEGFTRLDRYYRITHEGMKLSVWFDEDVAHCRVNFRTGLEQPPVLNEHMLGLGSMLARQFLGDEVAQPLEARFPHRQPVSTAEHLRVLRCPVLFASERLEILYPSTTLAMPLDSSNEHLSALLEDEARRLAARLPSVDSVLGHARAWICEQIYAGRDPRLEELARTLGMGTRTARRRLEAEGTTLRGLVDEVRRDMAVEHVAAGRLSLEEIALMTGFSEAATFRRAFKRWTGCSPAQYRRETDPRSS